MQTYVWLYLRPVPVGIVLVVAAVVLFRRHRSRRATGLAALALGGQAVWWLFDAGLLWGGYWNWISGMSPEAITRLIQCMAMAREAWWATCIVLFVCAVVADRRLTPAGPEVDYHDRPAG